MSDTEVRDWGPDHITVNGRHVQPGVEVSIVGQGKRRFRFISYDPRGWVNVWGGRPNREQLRSFEADRIGTVHRTAKIKNSGMPKATGLKGMKR